VLRSLPRRVPPPVLVRLGAVSRRIPPSRPGQRLPSSSSRFPLGPCLARERGGGRGAGTKRRCKPRSGPCSPLTPTPRLIHSGRGEKPPLSVPGGWGSITLLSFCAERQPRGPEEERGRRLRGLAASLLPLPNLPPPPGWVTSPPHPALGVCCARGGLWRILAGEGGKRRWRLCVGPDVPSASVLLQLLGIMEVAVSVSPCLTVYNMATFL